MGVNYSVMANIRPRQYSRVIDDSLKKTNLKKNFKKKFKKNFKKKERKSF